jgi:hypothetical protein
MRKKDKRGENKRNMLGGDKVLNRIKKSGKKGRKFF